MSEHGSDQTEPHAVETGRPILNSAITERDLRQLNRQFVKSIKSFNKLKKDSFDLALAKGSFNVVERCYAEVFEPITAFKAGLDAENDLEKIEDIEDKLELITQQYELARSSMNELEEHFKQQQARLIEDLQETSHKNTVIGSIAGSTSITHSSKSNRLFDYSKLTPKGRVLVAENKLKAAALQVDLAKKLAAIHNTDGQNNIVTSEPIQIQADADIDTATLCHGARQRNADNVDNTLTPCQWGQSEKC